MSWYKIQNSSGAGAEVYLFEEIGGWGVSAKRFINEIKELKGKITLHINSPGGSVFEGLAIYNVLKSLDVDVIVEGLAASMASVIAMSGKTVKMAKNSMMMIHNPITGIYGDSEELRKTADLLDRIKSQLVNTYCSFTGMSSEEISGLMSKETWFTADEAKAKGFCNEIIECVETQNIASVPLDYFQDPGQYQRFLEMQGATNTKKEKKMDELLKLLGVKNETEAVVKIDTLSTRCQALETKNQTLEAENLQLKQFGLEAKINQAVSEGKITPAQKDFAKTLLNKDESLFEEFIKNVASGKQGLTTEFNIGSGQTGDLTWENLMQDPIKAEELYNSNPELYNKLKNKYMEDNR